jgi:hypothetical protein
MKLRVFAKINGVSHQAGDRTLKIEAAYPQYLASPSVRK